MSLSLATPAGQRFWAFTVVHVKKTQNKAVSSEGLNILWLPFSCGLTEAAQLLWDAIKGLGVCKAMKSSGQKPSPRTV